MAAPNMRLLSDLFFYSKYVEYLDTIFLIVAGKPVSFLQYCRCAAIASDRLLNVRGVHSSPPRRADRHVVPGPL